MRAKKEETPAPTPDASGSAAQLEGKKKKKQKVTEAVKCNDPPTVVDKTPYLPLPGVENLLLLSKYVMDRQNGSLPRFYDELHCHPTIRKCKGDRGAIDAFDYGSVWKLYLDIDSKDMEEMGVGFAAMCLKGTSAVDLPPPLWSEPDTVQGLNEFALKEIRALKNGHEIEGEEKDGDTKKVNRLFDTSKKGFRANMKLRSCVSSSQNENNAKHYAEQTKDWVPLLLQHKEEFLESCAPSKDTGKRHHVAVHQAAAYMDVCMNKISAETSEETLSAHLCAFARQVAVGRWCEMGVKQSFWQGIGPESDWVATGGAPDEIFVNAVNHYRSKPASDNWLSKVAGDLETVDAVALWLYTECMYSYRKRFCPPDWTVDASDWVKGMPAMSLDVSNSKCGRGTQRMIMCTLTWCLALAKKIVGTAEAHRASTVSCSHVTVPSEVEAPEKVEAQESIVPEKKNVAPVALAKKKTKSSPTPPTEKRTLDNVLECLMDMQQDLQAAVSACRPFMKGDGAPPLDSAAKRKMDDAFSVLMSSNDAATREWKRFKQEVADV
jgi:hypothetical protein